MTVILRGIADVPQHGCPQNPSDHIRVFARNGAVVMAMRRALLAGCLIDAAREADVQADPGACAQERSERHK